MITFNGLQLKSFDGIFSQIGGNQKMTLHLDVILKKYKSSQQAV
ncbi:MAG: hypothetical protein ACJA0H_001461 [Francisellaceae bacterium]|jgi:hypothetical protein